MSSEKGLGRSITMLKVYSYKGCDGCRKALKWLNSNGFEYENFPIRDTPPSEQELDKMLAAYDGNLRRLFNVSSRDYRELGLKKALLSMSKKDAFAVLRSNGNLVKRPFLIGDNVAIVGFKEAEWAEAMGA